MRRLANVCNKQFYEFDDIPIYQALSSQLLDICGVLWTCAENGF